ncbi:flagellar hook assembly protein FlgD [Thermochromatium tepidum]|jgi:Flagellar hook capping protein|uniref:Basal-body rod modification protein FlgD n=1 Tax=Thermochromatium tepidum ATCC 43061 TaxID=316276 RepID=A0A6I6EFL9_THETI|nr:flagellar hook assembly protein FlgD [Thermochromatium tepidum]QGU33000.1 flagellar hook assembly protein FlgD [Thermochromatium tepidum ATCC 43061]
MTEVSTDYLSGLGLTAYSPKSSVQGDNELGQEDFLRLLTTQLTTQDPTNPVKNEDFVAQMAQFSTLTGIQDLTSSFKSLSQTLLQGQALEAASLVGKSVLVPSNKMELSEGQGVSGAVELSSSATQTRVDIYNASGQLVRTLDLGTLNSGLQEFNWDGKLANGSKAPAGQYEFRVSAQINGVTEALTPYLNGQVRSVSAESSDTGLTLSVQGIGTVSFSDVLRVS